MLQPGVIFRKLGVLSFIFCHGFLTFIDKLNCIIVSKSRTLLPARADLCQTACKCRVTKHFCCWDRHTVSSSTHTVPISTAGVLHRVAPAFSLEWIGTWLQGSLAFAHDSTVSCQVWRVLLLTVGGQGRVQNAIRYSPVEKMQFTACVVIVLPHLK